MTRTIEIDRQEYEDIKAEIADPTESRFFDVVMISGLHEDYGWTMIKREAGRFYAQVEEGVHVRGIARATS